jgi:hypothetical protein
MNTKGGMWIVLALCCLGRLIAQSTFGEIRGTVTDPTGAVVVGATVTATNTGTGDVRTLMTDHAGNYAVLNIEAGSYDLLIGHPGFQKTIAKGVALRAREVARVDAKLELAGAATEVMVTGVAQVITTDQATIVDSKSAEQIQDLPVNFRAGTTNSVFYAISTAPGVQPSSGGSEFSLSGSMPFMATASVDGISTISVRSNGLLIEMFPSADSINEIKVSSVSNNAEFAQVGDVTTTTRGGTNKPHGSLYWYHQNGAFDARDFFSVRNGAPFKISNDFGGSVSGPVIRNKTFVFGAYEGLRYRALSQIQGVVPPDTYRSGNLSAVTAAIRDPLNPGQTFAGNIIPSSRISPVSAKILELLYPHQSVAGNSISANNFFQQLSAGNTNNQYDLRVDQILTAKQSIFGRYSYKDVTTRNPASLPVRGDSRENRTSQNIVIAHNYLLRSSVINEFRGGYSDQPRNVDFGPEGKSFDGPALVKSLGIQGLRPDPPQVASIPDIGVTGFLGTGASRGFTQLSRTLQVTDSLTWVRGRHTVKFGADVRRLKYRDNVSFFSGDDLGEYRFNGMFSGNAFADFLLGYPNRTRLANTGPDVEPYTSHQGYFAQDDWKVTPKLTINFGARYEYHPPFVDSTLQIANFDRDYPGGRVIVPNATSLALTAPGFRASIGNTPIVTAAEAGLPESLRFSDKNNLMPRIGFAYRPFGNKTVLRGGYGVFTVTVLGNVSYSLVGIHTSDTRTFNNSLVNGVPLLSFPKPFDQGLGSVTTVGNADFRRANLFHVREPYVQQWNFTIERDLGWNTGMRVTYTGSHSIGLYDSPDLNQVHPNTVGYSVAKLNRPYPNWAIVYSRDTGVSAKYDALQTEVQKRLSNSLSFQTSWVWAKNLSNSTGSDGTGFASDNGSVPTDQFNLGLDYGNVSTTRRHRWLSTFTYRLPGGSWKPATFSGRAVKAAVAGWQFSGIAILQTGQFLTPITGGTTDPSGTNVDARANDRPDYTGTSYGNLPEDQRTITAWFDRSAFRTPPSNIGRFGLAGPGQLIGPQTRVFSAKLQKRFDLGEKTYVQLEGSAANLFNHTNFGLPARNLSSSTFGRITSTQSAEGAGPRNLQVGLRINF